VRPKKGHFTCSRLLLKVTTVSILKSWYIKVFSYQNLLDFHIFLDPDLLLDEDDHDVVGVHGIRDLRSGLDSLVLVDNF